jgi:hypothetical protein
MTGRFRTDRTFDPVMIPRFDGNPNGPKVPSFCECTCGARWNQHEFDTGACPVKVER